MDTSEAMAMCRDAMNRYGLTELGWYCQLDNAKRRFGHCRYRERCISLSAPLIRLNDVEDVLDTILHEIAHALAGPKANHGPVWRRQARAIGARPERCADEKVVTPPPTWIGTCPLCGKQTRRFRLTKATRRRSCACLGVWREEAIFVWRKA